MSVVCEDESAWWPVPNEFMRWGLCIADHAEHPGGLIFLSKIFVWAMPILLKLPEAAARALCTGIYVPVNVK